jgi:16S rRNA processing protein RimM
MFPENFKRIGKLSKSHGIQGTMVLKFEGNFSEDLYEREFLFVSIDATMIPFFIEEIRERGDDAFVKLQYLDSEKDASVVKGCDVYIPTSSKDYLSAPDILTGYVIRDETTGKEMKIKEYLDQQENPLFVVDLENREYMIPVQEDFIVFMDERKRVLKMKLPEGLFDVDE